MSLNNELTNILSECEKTGNYVDFNKRKKEFIDSKIIFNWKCWGLWRDWETLAKFITKSDVEYFYDIIKDDPNEMKKYNDVLVKYKVLPLNLFELHYKNLEKKCENSNKLIYDYIDTFLNKQNAKYFVFLLDSQLYFYGQNTIVQKILTMGEDIIDEDIINKIKSMNNVIDKKNLFQIAKHFESKINFRELVGREKYLEYCIDSNLIENLNGFEQEDINFILYYKMNKLETKINKLIENISDIIKIKKPSSDSEEE